MSGFWDDFLGKSSASDEANANAQARTDIQIGNQKASDSYTQKYNDAQGFYSPYATAGNKAQSTYTDALGLNGAAGGQNALSAYQAGMNPYLGYQQQYTLQGINNAANARGMVNSGANALASSRALQQQGYQDYQNWLGQVGNQAGMGAQVAGQQANLANQGGQYLGNIWSGQGQQLAGMDVSYGNALAASRSTGINNLLNVAGTAAKFFAPTGSAGQSSSTPVQYGGTSPGGVPSGGNWYPPAPA